MTSSPITSWQIDVETMETVREFIFLGCKITVDSDCSHEIKRRLLLGRKATTNLDSTLKSRDMTVDKGPTSQSYGFSGSHVWMCELDYIKKAECWRTDGFERWCWRLLRVPWTAKRSNLSIRKEISPRCSLEGLDAEAETPIFWPPNAKNWLIGKDPDAGKDWRQKEKRMTEDHHRLDGHEFEQAPAVGEG